MDVNHFFELFQDHLAPRLDTYEQAIYLYVFRHSRLLGVEEVVLGLKSSRLRMATGIGEAGRPMSESTCSSKLRSLEKKGCLAVLGVERAGTRIRLALPNEIPGLIPEIPVSLEVPLDSLDFYTDPDRRVALLEREGGSCFYCFRHLPVGGWVVEHVVSRPVGDNSYKNLVAACITCNNRKGATPVRRYLQLLYRDGLLSAEEHKERLEALERLTAGLLVPTLNGAGA